MSSENLQAEAIDEGVDDPLGEGDINENGFHADPNQGQALSNGPLMLARDTAMQQALQPQPYCSCMIKILHLVTMKIMLITLHAGVLEGQTGSIWAGSTPADQVETILMPVETILKYLKI